MDKRNLPGGSCEHDPRLALPVQTRHPPACFQHTQQSTGMHPFLLNERTDTVASLAKRGLVVGKILVFFFFATVALSFLFDKYCPITK